MTKLAQALVEETLSEKNRLTEFDTDQTILRKAKEDGSKGASVRSSVKSMRICI